MCRQLEGKRRLDTCPILDSSWALPINKVRNGNATVTGM